MDSPFALPITAGSHEIVRYRVRPLGGVITKLAKPMLPRYDIWFEAAPPYRVARFEGPYGPPGAPEIVLELTGCSAAEIAGGGSLGRVDEVRLAVEFEHL